MFVLMLIIHKLFYFFYIGMEVITICDSLLVLLYFKLVYIYRSCLRLFCKLTTILIDLLVLISSTNYLK